MVLAALSGNLWRAAAAHHRGAAENRIGETPMTPRHIACTACARPGMRRDAERRETTVRRRSPAAGEALLVVLCALGAGCNEGGANMHAGAAVGADVATPAGAAGAGEFMPADRRLAWNPGIPGGIPARTTTC